MGKDKENKCRKHVVPSFEMAFDTAPTQIHVIQSII